MQEKLKVWLPIAVVLAIIVGGFAIANWPRGDDAPAPAATVEPTSAATATRTPTARPNATIGGTRTQLTGTATRTTASSTLSSRRDLARDEAAGGHTLERHVARTDAQLRDRLKREPDISAASTYTDRDIAERVVGSAIQKEQKKITDWVKQGSNRTNLALRFDARQVVGRSIDQGKTTARDVSSATIVLRAKGSDWYVLTSYPDD
ncbi:MAG: RNase A-like domain-containing protein [Dehalococcoidia bacterium]